MDKRKAANITMDQAAGSLDQIIASFRRGGLLDEIGVPRLLLDPVLRKAEELANEYRAMRSTMESLRTF